MSAQLAADVRVVDAAYGENALDPWVPDAVDRISELFQVLELRLDIEQRRTCLSPTEALRIV